MTAPDCFALLRTCIQQQVWKVRGPFGRIVRSTLCKKTCIAMPPSGNSDLTNTRCLLIDAQPTRRAWCGVRIKHALFSLAFEWHFGFLTCVVQTIHYQTWTNTLFFLQQEYFIKNVGPIKKVLLSYGKTGNSLGVATIVFHQANDATKAAKEYDGIAVDKRPMKVSTSFLSIPSSANT